MDSIYGTDQRPREDLTARARIRDAAMAQFAELGFRAATMQRIAGAAGVSTGLVQHHFGTKDGLRRACDEAVLQVLGPQMDAIEHAETAVDSPDFAARLYGNDPVLVQYVIRMIVDGSDAGDALFDWMAIGTERFLAHGQPDLFPPDTTRTRDAATVLMIMHLGVGVLQEQLSRRLGVDVTDPTTSPRVGLLMLDLYEAMGRWVTSGTGSRARSALAAYVERLGPPAARHEQEHDDE